MVIKGKKIDEENNKKISFYSSFFAYNKILINNKIIISFIVCWILFMIFYQSVFFSEEGSLNSPDYLLSPEEAFVDFRTLYGNSSLLIATFFSMISVSIIFNKIIEISIYDLVKMKGNSYKNFVFYNFILTLIYSLIILMFLTLINGAFQFYYSTKYGGIFLSFSIKGLLKYFIYSIAAIGCAISISMFISSLNIDYAVRTMIITSFFFVSFIFFRPIIWTSLLRNKLDGDSYYIEKNPFISFLLLIPFIIWYFIISPISLTFFAVQFIQSPKAFNYYIQYHTLESVIWIYKLIFWVNFIEMISYCILMITFTTKRMRFK